MENLDLARVEIKIAKNKGENWLTGSNKYIEIIRKSAWSLARTLLVETMKIRRGTSSLVRLLAITISPLYNLATPMVFYRRIMSKAVVMNRGQKIKIIWIHTMA